MVRDCGDGSSTTSKDTRLGKAALSPRSAFIVTEVIYGHFLVWCDADPENTKCLHTVLKCIFQESELESNIYYLWSSAFTEHGEWRIQTKVDNAEFYHTGIHKQKVAPEVIILQLTLITSRNKQPPNAHNTANRCLWNIFQNLSSSSASSLYKFFLPKDPCLSSHFTLPSL